MPLRLIVAMFLLLVALIASLRNAKHGLFLLVLSVFINPGSLIWSLDKLHIPLLLGFSTAITVVREGKISRKDIPFPIQNYVFFLLMAWLTLSAVSGAFPERTYPMLDRWLKLFILFSLILRVSMEENDIRQMWFLILGALWFLAMRGVYHYFVGYSEVGGLPNSTMGDRNDFAMVLSMCFPFAYYFFRTEKGLFKIGFFFLNILFIGVTIITYSRMGFLLVCIYLVILFIQSRRKIQYLAMVITAVFIAVSFVPKSLADRLSTIWKYQEDASAMGRLGAWETGYRMILANPITGVGLDSFEIPEIYSRYASDNNPHVAHNAYIQIAAEAGIPALILYLLMIVITLFKMWRLRRESHTEKERLFCNAILVSLLIYCCGAVFLSAEDREALYILFASAVTIDILRRERALAELRFQE